MKEPFLLVLTYFITIAAQSATSPWKTALPSTSANALLLISRESKPSLVRNKGNYTDSVDAWSSLSFQEPIAWCPGRKSGLYPLYSISLFFIYVVYLYIFIYIFYIFLYILYIYIPLIRRELANPCVFFQGLCGGKNTLGKEHKRCLQVSVTSEQPWS